MTLDGIRLDSALIVDAPHGLTEPGQVTSHRFRATARMKRIALVAAVKQDSTYIAAVIFPAGTVASFKPEEGFASRVTVAGHDAYRVDWGAHGYNTHNWYVAIDQAKTLVVRITTLGDYLASWFDGGAMPIPEAEQLAVADAIVASIEL